MKECEIGQGLLGNSVARAMGGAVQNATLPCDGHVATRRQRNLFPGRGSACGRQQGRAEVSSRRSRPLRSHVHLRPSSEGHFSEASSQSKSVLTERRESSKMVERADRTSTARSPSGAHPRRSPRRMVGGDSRRMELAHGVRRIQGRPNRGEQGPEAVLRTLGPQAQVLRCHIGDYPAQGPTCRSWF